MENQEIKEANRKAMPMFILLVIAGAAAGGIMGFVIAKYGLHGFSENIDSHKSDTVYVPLGSCSNLYFLAGLGPNVPIRIYPVSIVNADFKESFDSVGINQVKHKLYLDVSMKMSFVGMMFAQSDTVETSVLLNETIIVGDTPTYYGNGGMTASVE